MQEVLPALVRAVERPVRPVAPHLFTAEERCSMAAIVDLLLAHGLTLALPGPDAAGDAGQQHGLPDATPLSPPVHRLVLFKVTCHPSVRVNSHICLVCH
jgi:hypothetical protein